MWHQLSNLKTFGIMNVIRISVAMDTTLSDAEAKLVELAVLSLAAF